MTALLAGWAPPAPAQQWDYPAADSARLQETADTAMAEEEERDEPGWRFLHVNELETPFMTFRVGAGVLVDYATYAQDDASEEQLELQPDIAFRDTRLMFRGIIKTPRPVSWQLGAMYDTNTEKWLVRQTGLIVPVPEIWGSLWIGRSKEGVSLNRIMVGYDGWTMERFPFSDASTPLLADGVKWMGYRPDKQLIWNLGVFTDWLSKGQTFSYYRNQVAGRIAMIRMDSDTAGDLLHVGVGGRIGLPTADSLRLRARPEAHLSSYIIDTGPFATELAGQIGLEAYYRPGSWIFGGEYYVVVSDFNGAAEPVDEPELPTPVDDLRRGPLLPSRTLAAAGARQDDMSTVGFHGGDVAVTWLITGETRAYATPSGSFRSVSPRRPVSLLGPGAWEAVLRFSYTNLNSGSIEGGSFWRITPMLNWHLTDNVRLEAAYGYGSLNRFGTTGYTHFFQSRIQTQL